MTIYFDDPRAGPGATFAGGEASLADIAGAAVDQSLYVDNTNAAHAAYERAYDERNDEVFADTGVRPPNPYRGLPTIRDDLSMIFSPGYNWREKRVADWQRMVAEAAARIPDQSVADRLNRSIDSDAARIARDSDARLGQLMTVRDGLGKYAALFAGGLAGSFSDPAQVLSILVGGGPGAGRTVASRILSVAAREALVNGATTAAMQPAVQAWRKKAGLDHGLEQALANVGSAAAFGGLVGGGGHLIGEGLGRLSGRALEAAGDAASVDGRVAPDVRAAMNGDVAAAREALSEIREALPPAARGALDQAEQLQHLDASRPPAAMPEHHDVTLSAAHRAIALDEPPRFTVDADQVERITRDIAGAPPAEAKAQARSLVQFLKDRGGVQDHNGELAAIGAGDLARKGKGKDRRLALDSAREAAEEAGYIGRPGETQVTSVADLLDAIDTELRGNRIFAREDAQPAAARNFEAQRASVERTVAEIAQHAGPAVDDHLIREASELSLRDGIEPFDALESVLIRAEPKARSRAARSLNKAIPEEARQLSPIHDEPLPGWSDAELEAASANRGPEPTGERTPFFDPGEIDPELTLTSADLAEYGDMMLPGATGASQSLRALVDDIKHGEGLAAIVKACKA